MKRFRAILATVLLLVSSCLIAAFPTSADGINWDDWIFDGTGKLVAYYGSEENIIIPTTDQNGVETVSISSEAFKGNTAIESVIIPEGITEIGSQCFADCTNLTEVSLPYSLVSCGKYSTFHKTSITSIVVPCKVKTIPSFFVVTENGQLSDIIITPGVEEIYSKAFYTTGLSELVIPKSVVLMGWGVVRDSSDTTAPTLKMYVLNPEAVVGRVADGDGDFEGLIGGNRAEGGPLADCFGGRKCEVYGVGDKTTAKTNVSKHMASKNGVYLSITEEKAAELEAELKEKGITKPIEIELPKAEETNKDNTDTVTDENSNNKDKDKDNTAVIVAVCVVLAVLVIAVTVTLIVLRKQKTTAK